MSFEPPSASRAVLQGLDFGPAIPVASDCKAAFDAADERPHNQDPSRCKALLRFPDETVFWSSKMAIDADGPAAGPGRLSGSKLDPEHGEGQDKTAYRFPNGGAFLSSEVVPYLVVPGREILRRNGPEPGRHHHGRLRGQKGGRDRRRCRPFQQDRRGINQASRTSPSAGA